MAIAGQSIFALYEVSYYVRLHLCLFQPLNVAYSMCPMYRCLRFSEAYEPLEKWDARVPLLYILWYSSPFTFPSPLPSFPSLSGAPPLNLLRGLGSVSPLGVWSKVPACERFDAYLSQKNSSGDKSFVDFPKNKGSITGTKTNSTIRADIIQ